MKTDFGVGKGWEYEDVGVVGWGRRVATAYKLSLGGPNCNHLCSRMLQHFFFSFTLSCQWVSFHRYNLVVPKICLVSLQRDIKQQHYYHNNVLDSDIHRYCVSLLCWRDLHFVTAHKSTPPLFSVNVLFFSCKYNVDLKYSLKKLRAMSSCVFRFVGRRFLFSVVFL